MNYPNLQDAALWTVGFQGSKRRLADKQGGSFSVVD